MAGSWRQQHGDKQGNNKQRSGRHDRAKGNTTATVECITTLATTVLESSSNYRA